MGIINSSQSQTSPLHYCWLLPGPVPWLLLMTIPLMLMANIAQQMTANIFFQNQTSFLAPMRYDMWSISSGKQLSQPAYIDCSLLQPLPFQIKNGKTFLLAVWNSSHWHLHVQRLKNTCVIYLGQWLMICLWTTPIQQLHLLFPSVTLRLKHFCGVCQSSTSGLSCLRYTSTWGQWAKMQSSVNRLSVMLCSSTHYRQLIWPHLLKVFTPRIGSLTSPLSFNLQLWWGSGLVINYCQFWRTSNFMNTPNTTGVLEDAVARFYTDMFFILFGHAAVIPTHLSWVVCHSHIHFWSRSWGKFDKSIVFLSSDCFIRLRVHQGLELLFFCQYIYKGRSQ